MIKLKDILLESTNEDLTKILKTDVLQLVSDTELKLIRSTKYPLNGLINIKYIRLDRRPRDMNKLTDSIVEAIRQLFFIDKPSRRKVLFCINSKIHAKQYGDSYYIVLPSKECDMYYSNTNSYEYRSDSYAAINDFHFQNFIDHMDSLLEYSEKKRDDNAIKILEYISSNFPNINNLLLCTNKTESDVIILNIKKLIGNDFDEFLTKLNPLTEKIRLRTELNQKILNVLYEFESLEYSIKKIHTYWSNLTHLTNISSLKDASEIQISGDYVYLIDFDFYDDYLEYKKKFINKSNIN
jgi:hypothetical protein